MPDERFELLQQFEGTVMRVDDGGFLARLRDLTAENPPESANFAMSDVSTDDLELVRPGAVFYWNIGYRTLKTGQKERSSGVRFRRLPMWSRSAVQRVESLAEEWTTLEEMTDAR